MSIKAFNRTLLFLRSEEGVHALFYGTTEVAQYATSSAGSSLMVWPKGKPEDAANHQYGVGDNLFFWGEKADRLYSILVENVVEEVADDCYFGHSCGHLVRPQELFS